MKTTFQTAHCKIHISAWTVLRKETFSEMREILFIAWPSSLFVMTVLPSLDNVITLLSVMHIHHDQQLFTCLPASDCRSSSLPAFPAPSSCSLSSSLPSPAILRKLPVHISGAMNAIVVLPRLTDPSSFSPSNNAETPKSAI